MMPKPRSEARRPRRRRAGGAATPTATVKRAAPAAPAARYSMSMAVKRSHSAAQAGEPAQAGPHTGGRMQSRAAAGTVTTAGSPGGMSGLRPRTAAVDEERDRANACGARAAAAAARAPADLESV